MRTRRRRSGSIRCAANAGHHDHGRHGRCGGNQYSQKYLYLDPPIAYSVHLSVEMLLVTIVGGMGTVFGPLIGSLVLHTVNEVTRNFIDTPGLT